MHPDSLFYSDSPNRSGRFFNPLTAKEVKFKGKKADKEVNEVALPHTKVRN